MTTTAVETRHIIDHGQTRHYLEALHFNGFSVTIHSPRTSHNGLYCVTAYGSEGKRPEMLRGSNRYLHDALKAAAYKLGGERLKAYASYVVAERLERAR